ncbi:MAG: hypothetical protein M1831_001340 [Alyxoria varia]|nr:MAG: hypothetical protein M1831_001340 [Alyxoria varia]
MPGHIRKYGRRTARQDSFVARCFAASSSPTKQELEPSNSKFELSPAQSTRSKSLYCEKSVDPSDDVFQPTVSQSSEVEPLLELVENLGIREDREDIPSRLPQLNSNSCGDVGNAENDSVLRDVDGNACPARIDPNEALKGAEGTKRKAPKGRKLKTEGGRAQRNQEKIRDQHDIKELCSPTLFLVDRAGSTKRNLPRMTSPGLSQKKNYQNSTQEQAIPTPPISPTPAQSCARRTRAAHAAVPSTLQKHASTSPPLDILAYHARPLLDLCNDTWSRASPTPFASWASYISEHLRITKIAEASYAEVYRLSVKNFTSTTLTTNDESVLKIIPLKPPSELVTTLTKPQRSRVESTMSTVRDVAAEVTLLQHMSTVPGFANFRDVKVMVGRPPGEIVSGWRDWDKKNREVMGEGSEFVDPGKKGSYAESQLWAVVEMQDAGRDLEGWCESQEYAASDSGEEAGASVEDDYQATDERIKAFRKVWGIWDVFWGVVLSLAKGEEWAGFEHRDLHLGNICVRFPPASSQPPKFAIDVTKNLNFTGVETTLIDYTLSRANLSRRDQSSTHSSDATAGDCNSNSNSNTEATTVGFSSHDDSAQDIAFHDLSLDPEIFAGDGADDYQYDIYRHMRGAVLFSDSNITDVPKQPRGNGKKRNNNHKTVQVAEQGQDETCKWREYHPLTNLVWLHFVLYKLTELLLVEWPSSSSGSASSSRRNGRGGGKRRTPVSEEEERERMVREKALELEGRLLELRDGILDLEMMKKRSEGVSSAAELVMWAVERAWFAEGDVLDA